jgi:uncharacterized protein YdhG (YjbR/CyaY superfamily)
MTAPSGPLAAMARSRQSEVRYATTAEVAMKSTAASVVAYIEEQPPEWQPTLRKLRAACRRQLRGYAERMVYGMPAYERQGQVEVSFGKQARYLSLYILKQPVFDAHIGELSGLSLGKGCVRYQRPQQVDWDVVSALLADTSTSSATIC